ncbi:MAG TPA: hypothetical protein DIC53_03960 [Synergistaceae bacterium]|jgi:multimeric flavodoxin WrbA|nr:hypothetical protein [Synergistaceae bacterium]
MRYLALFGSPRRTGNTAVALSSFLDGLASKGHEGEMVWLHGEKIAPCTSCNGCKKDGKGTGECVIPDDMEKLYSLTTKADLLIFAFPIYWWSMPAQVKLYLDRLYALDYSALQGKKLFLLMTYEGEDHNSGAELLKSTFRCICEYLEIDFIGSLGISTGSLPASENAEALEEAFTLGASV